MESAPLATITEVASLELEEGAGVVRPLRRRMLRTARAIQARMMEIGDFLRDSPALRRRHVDARANFLVGQMVDLIYDAEDCLVKYGKIGRGEGRRRPFLPGLHGCFLAFSVPRQMRYINDALRIWQEAATKWLSVQTAGAAHDGGDVAASHPRRHLRVSDNIRRPTDRRGPAGTGFVEEYERLGTQAPRERVLQLLLDGGSHLSVIAVVGTGDVGKTTLAQAVFNDWKVTERFHHRAWVSASRRSSDDTRSRVLMHLLLQFSPEPVNLDAEEGSEFLMASKIREGLKNRRYLIVLDDVCDADAWEAIKSVLPDDITGSRILVTSRSEQVAASFTGERACIYRLGALPSEDSWHLFCRSAFPSEAAGDHLCIPAEVEMVAREMVERCRGLPLAIKAIGSLMADTPPSKWKGLLELMAADSGGYAEIGKALQLIYEHLSHPLRLCFLYLSIYPRGYKIKRGHLLRLWAAERLVTEQRVLTAEEVAETYLNELINRSMVQVSDFDLAGRPRSLTIHDVIYDFIVTKSSGENFVALSCSAQGTVDSHKIRRLSIIDGGGYISPKASLSSIRTLVAFHQLKPLDQLMPTSFATMRVLKVVDLEGADLVVHLEGARLREFPAGIGTLSFLRYLSLKDTYIPSIPSSIGGLSILETLDLRGTRVTELPADIVGLKRLRHLLAAYCRPFYYQDLFECPLGVSVPPGIGQLGALEKLTGINISNVVDELRELIRLRTLAVTGLENTNAVKLCLSVEKLSCIRSLEAHYDSLEEPFDLSYIDSPPMLLEKLYLNGPIVELPVWIASLQSLVKVVLQRSRVKEPLKFLQDLPNLQQLELWHDVYTGEHLYFGEEGTDGFQSLRILQLRYVFLLGMVTIRRGTMPYLEKLVIERCMELKQMPLGLEHLAALRELYVLDGSDACLKRLQKEEGEDWSTIQHIPVVQIECGE